MGTHSVAIYTPKAPHFFSTKKPTQHEGPHFLPTSALSEFLSQIFGGKYWDEKFPSEVFSDYKSMEIQSDLA